MTETADQQQEPTGFATPTQNRDGHDLMQSLLTKEGTEREPDANASKASDLIFGIVIGQIQATLPDGRLKLQIAALGDTTCIARVACAPQGLMYGVDVAVMFEQGDVGRPMVIGPMYTGSAQHLALPKDSEKVPVERERIVIEADQELELRCGEATIVLTADGRILQRGTYISSNASATQRILGGSVQIN